MGPLDPPGWQLRFTSCAATWGVTVDRVVDTGRSVVAFGQRNQQPVVLKVVKAPGDEWDSGRMLDAFGGRGVVRAIDYADGALLLERVVPGTPLGEAVADDRQATAILADVVRRMAAAPVTVAGQGVASWAGAFDRYLAGTGRPIPEPLVREAHRRYLALCGSQGATRLLHGDLHHHNVLLDDERGWLAIDPKGVVGEDAYEVGAALRNPAQRPEIFAAPATVERRVGMLSGVLGLDADRILGWAFAQAVLAAVWELEDDGVLTAGEGWLALATSVLSIEGLSPDE